MGAALAHQNFMFEGKIRWHDGDEGPATLADSLRKPGEGHAPNARRSRADAPNALRQATPLEWPPPSRPPPSSLPPRPPAPPVLPLLLFLEAFAAAEYLKGASCQMARCADVRYPSADWARTLKLPKLFWRKPTRQGARPISAAAPVGTLRRGRTPSPVLIGFFCRVF